MTTSVEAKIEALVSAELDGRDVAHVRFLPTAGDGPVTEAPDEVDGVAWTPLDGRVPGIDGTVLRAFRNAAAVLARDDAGGASW